MTEYHQMNKTAAMLTTFSLCLIKLILTLLASGTFPVIGQVLKGYAVMLGRIINISAYGTDILSACLPRSPPLQVQSGRDYPSP